MTSTSTHGYPHFAAEEEGEPIEAFTRTLKDIFSIKDLRHATWPNNFNKDRLVVSCNLYHSDPRGPSLALIKYM